MNRALYVWFAAALASGCMGGEPNDESSSIPPSGGDDDKSNPVAVPTYSPEELALIKRQEAVDAIADQLRERIADDNFSGLVVDPDNLGITVWLVDPTALDASDLSHNQDGVKIAVHAGKYAQRDLMSAGEHALTTSLPDLPAVFSAAPSPDGSGTTFTIAASRTDKEELARRFSDALGVAVRVEFGSRPQMRTRWNDSSPWYGGGAMTHWVSATDFWICSTGFSLLTSTGYGRLLSAAHCDTSGNWAWTDGARDPLTTGGSAVSVSLPYDSMVFDPVGGTGGWVHGGPWNATSSNSRYHLKVATSAPNYNGDYVCSSGAMTGEHCSLKVTYAGYQYTIAGNSHVLTGVLAVASSSTACASGGGDSGGPVYATRSDGRVTARGIISAGFDSSSVHCPSAYPLGSDNGNDVIYLEIQHLTHAWGLTLETTP